jgi:hypothetical protein
MLYLQEFFNIPGPKDLGMSDSNHGMNWKISSKEDGFGWDDYYAKIKANYPVYFFFCSSVPTFFSRKASRVERAWWKVLHNFHPKHRYHMLDLREDKSKKDAYRQGWIDADSKIELALFKIFTDFVEKELDQPHVYIPTRKEVADAEGVEADSVASLRASYDEIFEIYAYVKSGYKDDEDLADKSLDAWYTARKNCSEDTDRLFEEHLAISKKNDARLTDYLCRMIKIRNHLWT